MLIGSRSVSENDPPFIIAELSSNHDQSLSTALKMVEAVAGSGAHAIKLQTFTPDMMTLNIQKPDFLIQDSKSLWYGQTLYDLYTKAQTPWEWHSEIFAKAADLGLVAFSTPFDETAVEFLEELDVPCFKIASFENNHLPLIKKIAQTNKPILLSSGLASKAQLEEAIATIREAGGTDILLMKCTSNYPAEEKDSNIKTIPDIREQFSVEVGISDHTLGIGVAVAAVGLGATAIEKHFVLERSSGSLDAAFSLEPDELTSLVVETGRAWRSLGHIHYGPTESEEKSCQFRRSIYVSKDLKIGDLLSKDSIKVIRPGYGLEPKYLDQVLGQRVMSDIPAGSPLNWDMISKG